MRLSADAGKVSAGTTMAGSVANGRQLPTNCPSDAASGLVVNRRPRGAAVAVVVPIGSEIISELPPPAGPAGWAC